MALPSTSEMVEFFWNGLTNIEMIGNSVSTKANYVMMEVSVKFLDKLANNGWRYVTEEGDYFNMTYVQEVVQGIVANINAAATSESNAMMIRVHNWGNTSPNRMKNDFEFFNINTVLPFMSVVVTLNTERSYAKYSTTAVSGFTGTTGASAASSMNDAVTDVSPSNIATSTFTPTTSG